MHQHRKRLKRKNPYLFHDTLARLVAAKALPYETTHGVDLATVIEKLRRTGNGLVSSARPFIVYET